MKENVKSGQNLLIKPLEAEEYEEFVFNTLKSFIEEYNHSGDQENMPAPWAKKPYVGMLQLDVDKLKSEPFETKRHTLKRLLTVHRFDPSEEMFEAIDRIIKFEQKNTKITNWEDLENLNKLPEIGKCKISIWRGDICTLKVDAIVNAANKFMLGCTRPDHPCIDNAIHDKAGPRLRATCREMMRAEGDVLPTGVARITPAYCLPSDYILHTVGPIYPKTGDRPDLLANCYIACLKLAKEKGIRSVAFCCISIGIFGYPVKPATEVALKTVKNFLETDENHKHFDGIVFNVFMEQDQKLYEELLPQIWNEGHKE